MVGTIVGVSVGIAVNAGIKVDVAVGGANKAVWVDAAFAVPAIMVLIELGSNVGAGAGAVPMVGAHAKTIAVIRPKPIALLRRFITVIYAFYLTLIATYG